MPADPPRRRVRVWSYIAARITTVQSGDGATDGFFPLKRQKARQNWEDLFMHENWIFTKRST